MRTKIYTTEVPLGSRIGNNLPDWHYFKLRLPSARDLFSGVRNWHRAFETSAALRQLCRAQHPRLPPRRLWEMKDVFLLDTSLSSPRSTAWSADSASQPSRTWKDEAVRSRRRLCSNSWRDWRRIGPTAPGRPETMHPNSTSSCLALVSVSN